MRKSLTARPWQSVVVAIDNRRWLPLQQSAVLRVERSSDDVSRCDDVIVSTGVPISAATATSVRQAEACCTHYSQDKDPAHYLLKLQINLTFTFKSKKNCNEHNWLFSCLLTKSNNQSHYLLAPANDFPFLPFPRFSFLLFSVLVSSFLFLFSDLRFLNFP